MIKKNRFFEFAFYILFTTLSLSTTLIIIRLSISTYFFIFHGKFNFSTEDIYQSLKAGAAASLPLSIGIFVLEKIEYKNNLKNNL